MKATLQKLIGMAVLGLALVSNSLPAWAGGVSHPQVSIGPYGAEGSMAGARYSADSRQYIGCSLDTGPRAQCAAQDSADNFAYCFSDNPKHVDSVQRMTDSSYIVFKVDRATGACKSIHISNNSSHLQ